MTQKTPFQTTELIEFAGQHAERLLCELLAAPSINPPGNEEVAAEKLAAFLKGFGIDIEQQYVEPERPNLLAAVGPGGAVPSMALCSHLDVVDPGDPTAWTGDPFVPRLAGDRIYGRGACDAKASLTAMALVLAFFACRPEPLPGRLVLAAVAGEERGGIGSKYLMQSGFRADAAIIGEPTNLGIALGHKGRIQVEVVIHGRAGHASRPESAVNPIDSLTGVLESLSTLSGRVAQRYHPFVGTASLVVTRIQTGSTNAATIPGQVILTLDRRLVLTETHDAAGVEIQEALSHLEQVHVEWCCGAYPALQERTHLLVSAACASAKGMDVRLVEFPATCDQYIWLGSGIPTLTLGPGDISMNHVHGVDEYIELGDIVAATVIYARTAWLFLNSFITGRTVHAEEPPGI
jgi:succinyl-diaminopimelate desuccinylase